MRLGLSLYILLALHCLSGCSKHNSEIALAGFSMGTDYSVKIAKLPPHIKSEQLQQDIAKILDDLDNTVSNYKSDSEISQFNRFEAKRWFVVSFDTFQLIKRAQKISETTVGALDITIEPLIDLWGFSTTMQAKIDIPTPTAIQLALNKVGYHQLQLQELPLAIKKLNPELSINLSSLVPGYAADKVAAYLNQQGVANYLIDLGGELKARGTKSDGSLWRVAIERPIVGKFGEVARVITLENTAISTAGDYRNFFAFKDKNYSHIIDPKTGWPVTHSLIAVTVIHDSAGWADAWDTALLVLGPEKGLALARQHNIAAFFILKEGQHYKELWTPAFEAYGVSSRIN